MDITNHALAERRAKGLRRALMLVAAALLGVSLTAPAHPASAAVSPAPVLSLPVADGQLLRLAQIPAQPWLAGHRGVDILTEEGADVLSPGAGTVAFAGMVAGRPVLTILLDVGVSATLEPVVARVDVGERVTAGQHVATASQAQSHCAPRVCVHWGVREGEVYHDPLDWLAGFGPVVLLPVE